MSRFEDDEDRFLWTCDYEEDDWCLEYDMPCSDVPRGECKRG